MLTVEGMKSFGVENDPKSGPPTQSQYRFLAPKC